MPPRPTFLMSPKFMIPLVTVQKTIGLINIFSSLMSPSPSGLRPTANVGRARWSSQGDPT